MGGGSRATLVLLFLVGILASSLLTFMITSGYWYWLGKVVPERPSIAITELLFPANDTSYFNVTVLNPSYSMEPVHVERVLVITPDGELVEVETTRPRLPLEISAGEKATISCDWDWANYTGREVTVVVAIKEGSGASFTARTPLVKMLLSATFDASTPFWFMLNITNARESATALSLAGIDLVLEGGRVVKNVDTEPKLAIGEPYKLEQGASVLVNCSWNWLEYRNKTVTVVVKTIEGYRGYLTERTPGPVVIRITEVAFYNVSQSFFMNVTVFNEPYSPAPAKICNITITIGNDTYVPERVKPSIRPYYALEPNASVTFNCLWNWSAFQGMNATIKVSCVLGYEAEATVNVTAGTVRPALGTAKKAICSREGGEAGKKAAFSSPRLSGRQPGERGLLLCAPPARRRTSALCAPARCRRSSRRGWPLPMHAL